MAKLRTQIFFFFRDKESEEGLDSYTGEVVLFVTCYHLLK